jgi:hypothetical protein
MAGDNPRTINATMQDSLTDQGFMRSIGTCVQNWADESGVRISGATTPVFVSDGNVAYAQWAAANNDVMIIHQPAPQELAKAEYTGSDGTTRYTPNIKLDVKLTKAAGSDTPTLACPLYVVKPDGTKQGPWLPRANLALPATAAGVYTLEYHGQGVSGQPTHTIDAGDELFFNLTPGAHGTDTLQLRGATVRCKVNASITNVDNRA